MIIVSNDSTVAFQHVVLDLEIIIVLLIGVASPSNNESNITELLEKVVGDQLV